LKSIFTIALVFICLDIICQTKVNKKPIPINDTISMPNDLQVWGFDSEASLLHNDKDPEGNAMKVTTFRIDSTTVDIKANQFVYLKGKGILTIQTNGRPIIFPFPEFDGYIRLSYVVNDYFSGNGKRGYVLIYIWQ